MNNQNPNFSKIEDYLFGDMSEKEKTQFESEIATNNALKKEVNLHKIEHQTMELLVQKDLKANLNEWKKEKLSTTQQEAPVISINRNRRLFTRLAAAASVLLIIGMFAGNLLLPSQNNSAIAGDFFNETSIADRANKKEASNLPAILIPGVQAMQAKEYQTAANLFGAIKDELHQETAQILQAECYFQLKNYEQTINICTPLSNSQDDSIQEKAAWYLVLSYLAQEKEAKAKELLQPILKNPNHSYHPYAKTLEQELDSFWKKFSF